MATELVKIRVPHQHVGDIPDYHEWVYTGPYLADSRGRSNPRMLQAMWQAWVCNNADCPARGIVHYGAIQNLLDDAEAAR